MTAGTFRTFSDPEAFYPAIRARRVDGVVTERGQFQADLTRVDFRRLLMQRANEHLARVWNVETTPQRASFIFATDQGQSAMHVSGLPLRAGSIIAWNSGFAGHHKSAAAGSWGSMSLKLEDFSTSSETVLGRLLPAPSGFCLIRPPELLMKRLLDLHETAGHLARTTPDRIANPEVNRAIEQALIEALMSCLSGGDMAEPRSAASNRGKVLRRLEQVLEANPEQALYMGELCAAVGASYPTLRACCHEHLGMSPKRYLWLRRMDLARRALRRAAPKVATVTEIATGYGFWELGRFSVAYRSLFGEPPSVTLHRPPENSAS
jgi:AraC-like DNA-binding protein